MRTVFQVHNSRVAACRTALAVTTALVAFSASGAFAQTVNVTTSETAAALNAQIVAAENTPSSPISVSVSAPAVITAGNVVLSPLGTGKGDGAISFTNSGNLGVVTAGAVTDPVGVYLNGVGTKAAANTATVNNSGLVTNSIYATGFGGDVSITNGGTVYGSLIGAGYGNVTVSTSPSGSIVAPSVNVAALAYAHPSSSVATAGGITTTTYTSGNAEIDQNGNALLADGTTPANLVAYAPNGNATVNVGAKAGVVTAAGGFTPTTSVTASQSPVVSATTTTYESDTSYGAGAAAVTIASGGSVTTVGAYGPGGATVLVSGSGTVGTGGINAYSSAQNGTNQTQVTEDSGGNVTSTTYTNSATQSGGAALVTVNSGGIVNSNINAAGDAGATVVANGNVKGSITASQQTGPNTSYTETDTPNETVIDETSTYAPGTASVAVGTGVTVSGGLTAQSNGTASVTTAANSIINGGVAINTSPGSNIVSHTDNIASGGNYTNSYMETDTSAGAAAKFANAGYVQGPVDIRSNGNVTATNTGQVTGTTSITAGGAINGNANSQSFTSATASGITTATTVNSTSNSYTPVAASITGTYSGTNGEASFAPVTSGSIAQYATGASTLTESGTVYGSLTSNAGATGNSDAYSTTTVTTTDGKDPATGTYVQTYKDAYTQTPLTGGISTVTVSGLVSNALGSVAVNSYGNTGSTVNVSGTVDGSVTSNASGESTYQYNELDTTNFVTTAGVTDQTYTYTYNDAQTTIHGAAVGNVTGTGLVTGGLTVDGVSSATSQIDAGATLNGRLNVSTGGTDYTDAENTIYTYVPATTTVPAAATEVDKSTYTYGPSAGSGDASANIDGTVYNTVSVNAARGNASLAVQGLVTGPVSATADGTVYAGSSESDYAGTSLGEGLALTKYTSADTATNVGGVASVVIDTSPTFQGQNVGSTVPSVSSVYASGLGGANVTVAAGSLVGSYVSANSQYTDSSVTDTKTYIGASGTQHTVTVTTPVGGIATVTNAGTINGTAYANGIGGATITNSGTADYLSASSLADGYQQTFDDNDINNVSPSTRVQTTTRVYTPVGNDASITNTGLAVDGASLSGATGTLTNNGVIGIVPNPAKGISGNSATITLGSAVLNGTAVKTVNSTTTLNPTLAVQLPGTLFNQSYTVNQNGVLYGDVLVTGADSTYNGKPFQTSNVQATINLNTGSTTTGSFYGDNDTNTVVNVNGGNLVLSGQTYIPASASNAVPVWSAGLVGGATGGSFALNVNSGIVSFAPLPLPTTTNPNPQFGLNGSVNIGSGGTFVIGSLNPNPVVGAGASIVGVGPTVNGINLVVSGNFATAGTLVVGLNGSIVRSPLFTASVSTDLLAPVTQLIGSAGALYTTPGALGTSTAINQGASVVNVGGNLNLGGTIKAYVPTGTIFTGTESEVLFNVAGTITNTATVSTNLPSTFVTLTPVTVGQTVVLDVTRASYATAANNPNAAAAAVGLDKAVPYVAKFIADDVAGIRDYTSLTQFSNVQDLANIVSTLDWNLTKAQAGEVFNELASGSIYGSLANLHQNVAFEGQVDQLVQRRNAKEGTLSLWITPIGNFAKYGGTSSGAYKIDATSYGAAVGVDIGYSSTGAFGFGFGYTKHNVDTQGFPSSADANTYTVGTYWTQGFGPVTASAKFDYGFSVFNVHRDLAVLQRNIAGHFRGNEWDGSLDLAYQLTAGDIAISPYGELAVRHWHMNGLTETGGGGVGLVVDGASKTVFDPSVGILLGSAEPVEDHFALRPFGRVSYTFQGDAGTYRTVQYVGDPTPGDSFVLRGVNPKGYGTVEAGLTAIVAGRANVGVSGSYEFAGNNKVAAIRGVIGIGF